MACKKNFGDVDWSAEVEESKKAELGATAEGSGVVSSDYRGK